MHDRKIKLISCNYNNHAPITINNQGEINKLSVEVALYGDTDQPSRVNALHGRLKGKIPKMLEWEKDGEYDYYIWVDSKFKINEGTITKLIEELGEYEIGLFKHPHRTSIMEELTFMEKEMYKGNYYLTDRYLGEDMRNQVELYIKDNSFVDNQLFACGCFIYTKNLIKNSNYNLLKEWFYHNALYSIQDQLSLPYLLHKFKTNYTIFSFDLLNNTSLTYNNF